MKVRVMHVIEAMHQGGAESLVVEHVRHAGAGIESIVCAINRGGPALEAVRALGARAFVLSEGGSHRIMRGFHLASRMREEGVTVVNGHNPTGALYATLAGTLARVPVRVRTEHSIHYPGRHSGFYTVAIEPVLTALNAQVICVCEAVKQSHAGRLGWAKDKFVVIANGISARAPARPRESIRQSLGISPTDRIVLTIGSLTRQKAQHVLLEAFARVSRDLPDARLWIAGDGPLRGTLERLARELGIASCVRLLGARDDAGDLIEAADVFVLSSVREGLSVTLLEAMRSGRAAVATRVGGNAEAVDDGETGQIVPPGDPGALAVALTSLLADRERAESLGRAAHRRWERCFTAERMVRETEDLYRAELARVGVPLPAGASAVPERHAAP